MAIHDEPRWRNEEEEDVGRGRLSGRTRPLVETRLRFRRVRVPEVHGFSQSVLANPPEPEAKVKYPYPFVMYRLWLIQLTSDVRTPQGLIS